MGKERREEGVSPPFWEGPKVPIASERDRCLHTPFPRCHLGFALAQLIPMLGLTGKGTARLTQLHWGTWAADPHWPVQGHEAFPAPESAQHSQSAALLYKQKPKLQGPVLPRSS